MKRVIVKLQIQEFMDLYPHSEHRIIDNTPEGIKGIEDFIQHMNTHWSGGVISTEYKILTESETKAFLKHLLRDDHHTIDEIRDLVEELGLNEFKYTR